MLLASSEARTSGSIYVVNALVSSFIWARSQAPVLFPTSLSTLTSAKVRAEYSLRLINMRVLFVVFAALMMLVTSGSRVAIGCPKRVADVLSFFSIFSRVAGESLMATRGISIDISLNHHEFQHLRNLAEPNAAVIMFGIDHAERPESLCYAMWSYDVPVVEFGEIPDGLRRLAVSSRNLRRAVVSDQAQIARAPKLKSLPNRAAQVLEPADIQTIEDNYAVDPAKDLAEIFFPPTVRNRFDGIERLTVIPVLNMATVPVGMLQPYGDGRMVIDLFSVNFLPLAFEPESLYGWRPSSGIENALIIGNPSTHDPEYEFPQLRGAEGEALALHSLVGGQLLLRSQATRKAFLAGVEDADLIAIAAHAVAGDSLEESFVALAGGGRLTAREVQGLNLPRSPIVVLSACQTGLGVALDAGVIGIARAFQIAGARNTVMSLWNIDDEATKHLMQNFYRELLLTANPAEAMRRAAIETRKLYPDPAKWAAFAIFGLVF